MASLPRWEDHNEETGASGLPTVAYVRLGSCTVEFRTLSRSKEALQHGRAFSRCLSSGGVVARCLEYLSRFRSPLNLHVGQAENRWTDRIDQRVDERFWALLVRSDSPYHHHLLVSLAHLGSLIFRMR